MNHPPAFHVRAGTIDEYRSLAHLHYLPVLPATRVRILVATIPADPAPIGGLVVSMPVLNARWRDAAFAPDYQGRPRYRTGCPRDDARRINRELRTISRVVVDPRFRCLGVATALVREYLRDPLTPATEAVATMGAFSRFFVRAGMSACPPQAALTPADVRLGDALHALGVPPWLLADPSRIAPRILQSPFLARELRRWAQRSRATRPFLSLGTRALLRRAAGISFPPAVFVHAPPSRDRSAA